MSGDAVCDWSATRIRSALLAKEISTREVVQAHLDRTEAVNPHVNAIVTQTAEAALDRAAESDEALARGTRWGPLHGLPVAIKDTHATAGIRTTHGSPLLVDHVPTQDDLVVARVREAGAIIMGKTNVPEFGAGSHTYNSVFGATRNPYHLDRSAGGSSGGSAAALATGMVALADGSDMGGSLRNPASFCNVSGLRPTPGRVPSVPAPLPWSSLIVQGPMARTVGDLQLLLSVQAGPDPRAPLSLTEPGESMGGPLGGDLRGLKVAWTPDLGGAFPVDPEVVDALAPALAVLQGLGATVEAAAPDLAGAEESFRVLRAQLFSHMLGEQVDAHPSAFKDSLRWNVDVGHQLSGDDVARAHRTHGEILVRTESFFSEHDLLVMPVSQVVPFDVTLEHPTEVAGEPQHTYLDWMRSAYFVTMTGCPAISVPAGFTPQGLPVGLQIVGPQRSDRALLRIAHLFEQASQASLRRPALLVA